MAMPEEGNPLPAGYQQGLVESHRDPAEAPIRKLTVDLIKTYRKINEVRTLACAQL
jgi:hypothetical protein